MDNILHEIRNCPVEWRSIGDAVEFKRGTQLKPNEIKNGIFPVVTASRAESAFHEKSNFPAESVTVTSHGAYAGHVNLWETPIWLANNVFLLAPKDNINSRYLYYFLKKIEGKIRGTSKGGGIPYINARDISIIKIPIPYPETPAKSLAVQSEIVRILDTFTAVTSELTSELTTRKTQYNYYRDELLKFEICANSKASIKTLGEVGNFIRGTGIQKSDFTQSGVACIHYGQIHTHYGIWAKKTLSFISHELASRLRKAKTGDLIIATTSEDDEAVAKAVAWMGSEEVAVSTDAYIFQHTLNPKYVSYFFQTEQFQKQKKPYITGTKVRRISGENLGKILIPVPPREQQDYIVAILDKFDTLTHSITDGLPREIELRQKQYAYYRDLLFNFPQPV